MIFSSSRRHSEVNSSCHSRLVHDSREELQHNQGMAAAIPCHNGPPPLNCCFPLSSTKEACMPKISPYSVCLVPCITPSQASTVQIVPVWFPGRPPS